MTKKTFPPVRPTVPTQTNQDGPTIINPNLQPADATNPPSIEATLAERGARYGDFKNHARIAMLLKDAMRYSVATDGGPGRDLVERPGWARLPPDAAQALDTICDKIARILNGDPNYDDNWRDISGYATLVLNRILKEQQS